MSQLLKIGKGLQTEIKLLTLDVLSKNKPIHDVVLALSYNTKAPGRIQALFCMNCEQEYIYQVF